MANEIPDISPDMQRLSRRFERWRNAHTGRLPIPARLWTAAAELARKHGVFPTAKALRLEYGKLKQQAELLGPTTKRRGRVTCEGSNTSPEPRAARPFTAEFCGVDGAALGQSCQRGGGVRRAARPDEDRVQGRGRGRVGDPEPGLVGRRGMIQITPQMRILMAVEPVDGRKYAPSTDMQSPQKTRLRTSRSTRRKTGCSSAELRIT